MCDNSDILVRWMSSHLYGILLTMVTVNMDNGPSNVGLMPKIQIDAQSEFDYYRHLQLDQQEIDWLQSLLNT